MRFLDVRCGTRRAGCGAAVFCFAGLSACSALRTSIPEVGRLTDRGAGQRSIVIRLGEQKAYLYRDGKAVAISRASAGREGYATPAGKFKVREKDIDHRSSIYGAYVRDGRIIKADVDSRKDRRPAGATYVGFPMPYFLRVHGAVGIHAGDVPGYPASHGCIRLPRRHAARFYHAVDVGTPVVIYR